MAKKKKPDDEDLPPDEDIVEAEEEATEVVDEAVEEVAGEEAVEPAGDLESMELGDEALAVADEDVAAVEADEAVAAVEAVEDRPQPAVHWLNYALIGLNVVAALAFAYFLLQDYHRRQEYAYAVQRTELAMIGLPSDAEEAGPAADRATLPNVRVSEETIKQVVSARISGVSDPVFAVDEPIARHIKPSDLDKDLLKDHFGEYYLEDNGKLIRTIDDEVRRLDKLVLGDFQIAATDGYTAIKGGDAVVRTEVEKLLLPLAMDTYQAESLDKRISGAQGKALKDLYLDTAQRRMAFDFLLPLELYRPGDPKVAFLEKFGDLEAMPLKNVLERVTARLGSAIAPKFDPGLHLSEEARERDTVEKRIVTSLTLLSLAYVKRPDGYFKKTPDLLYPKLRERLPLVVGQYDFAVAAGLLPGRVRIMNERLTALLREEREGFIVTDADGKVQMSWGFPQRYERGVQDIRFTQQDIQKAQLRYQDLVKDKERYEQLLAERAKQRDEVVARIAQARTQTAQDNAELRQLQDRLFEFQRQLARSEQQLQELSDKMRQGPEGGK